MRVLQINIFYDEGSTGKIVSDIHKRLLRYGHESYIVFGRGFHEVSDDPEHLYRTTTSKRSELYRKLSRITGLRYNTAYVETYKLIKHIERIKPDIVHLHCMNCAYVNPFILLKYLGDNNYPVLVTHHADVTISANCDHSFECDKWKTGCGRCPTNIPEKRSFLLDNTHLSWVQMRNAFSHVKRLYANGVSDWMTNRVRQSPFFKNAECRTILNGLDTEAFQYRGEMSELREKHRIGKRDKIVLHVTPDFSAPIKGGKYVVELAEKMPDVKVIVVGIKDYEINNLPSNIIPVNHIDSKEQLSEYYSLADVTLLTSYRESFSMVTAESLCCGTPVVGFKAGAPETIAIPEYSDFVEYGDMDNIYNKINVLTKRNITKKEISFKSRNKYDAEIMFKSYLDFYETIFEKIQ